MRLNNYLLIGLLSIASLSCAQEQKSQKSNTPSSNKMQAIESPKITMVELGSVNCIPCRAMSKVMDSLEILFPQELEIRFHDVWTEEGKPYGQKYGIRSIPTQVFLDAQGKEIHRHEGFYAQHEIISFLQSKGISK